MAKLKITMTIPSSGRYYEADVEFDSPAALDAAVEEIKARFIAEDKEMTAKEK